MAETKLEVLQSAVAKIPRVSISACRIQISFQLGSSSEVMLFLQSYFKQHLLPKIKLVMSEKVNAHTLFNLKANAHTLLNLMVTNDGQLPIKMYTELKLPF